MVKKNLSVEDLVKLTTSDTFVFSGWSPVSVSPALRAEAFRQIVGRCLNADKSQFMFGRADPSIEGRTHYP